MDFTAVTEEEVDALMKAAVAKRVKELRIRRLIYYGAISLQFGINLILVKEAHQWQQLTVQCVSLLKK